MTNQSPETSCRLCERKAVLKHSHVLPAFTFRWLVDTAGKSPIRGAKEPNLRIQDGPKEYWLCGDCEQLFSKSEAAFATRIFHPHFKNPSSEFRYGKWMTHFCVSISWRALLYHQTRNNFSPWSDRDMQAAAKAEAAWRGYLLGIRRRPGEFHQHILPFDHLASVSGDWSSNLSRYLTRAIDLDFPSGPEMAFTYAKFGRFMVLGMVRCAHPESWKGTRVDPVQGSIRPRQYGLPAGFMQFVDQKARDMRSALETVSHRQQEKMQKDFIVNASAFAGSDSEKAVNADINVFGDKALIRRSAKGRTEE